MILVDTNLLLRSVQPGHAQCQMARNAVKAVRQLGYVPCIVPQIVYEYWVVATRPLTSNGLGLSSIDAEADIARVIEQFHLFRDERTIFDRWQRLVVQYEVHGKTAHDARLVAAMERHGIEHLLTFNTQDFQRFPFLIAVHPESVGNLAPFGTH